MQIKITVNVLHTYQIQPKSRALTTSKVGGDVEQKLSYTGGGNTKLYGHLGKQFGDFLKKNNI